MLPPAQPNTADVEALKARIVLLESMVSVERLRAEQAERTIKDLLRRMFGPKSEKLDPNQFQIAFEQVSADQELHLAVQPLPQATANAESKPKSKGGGRKPLPQNQPVVTTLIDLSEAEKAGLVKIREEVTEEQEYRPSQFYIHRIIRPVYAHPQKEHAPKVAALPARVIPQSGVGPGLLANILVSKYVDHLPLNRIQMMAARQGLELTRQKQCRWVEDCAHLLLAVQERLKHKILESRYVQADETPVRLLDPDRGGHAAQAYLWTYHAPNDGAILFDFNLSRGRDSPERFFPTEWDGILQSDGYELYSALTRDRSKITHLGCLAHLRRYVVEAIDGGGEDVAKLLAQIGALYRLEARAKQQQLSIEQRAALRHGFARPILKDLQRHFTALQKTALPKSGLGKAATYALNHWPQIARYAKHRFAHVHPDNNPVERAIRPTKLGMKNWMFIGHPDAGWRSAVMYSIVGSCKLNQVNPEAYLKWVLPKLAAATNHTADGLLPHDFARLFPGAIVS